MRLAHPTGHNKNQPAKARAKELPEGLCVFTSFAPLPNYCIACLHYPSGILACLPLLVRSRCRHSKVSMVLEEVESGAKYDLALEADPETE